MCMCVRSLNSCVFLSYSLGKWNCHFRYFLSLFLERERESKTEKGENERCSLLTNNTLGHPFSCWVKVLRTHFTSYVYTSRTVFSFDVCELCLFVKGKVVRQKGKEKEGEKLELKDNKQQPQVSKCSLCLMSLTFLMKSNRIRKKKKEREEKGDKESERHMSLVSVKGLYICVSVCVSLWS